jgi:hypothetical protein
VTNYDDVEKMVEEADNEESDDDEDFEEGISGGNIAGLEGR